MTRAILVDDLSRFHENAAADWATTCTDDELTRVCDVADFLTLYGPVSASGASMTLSKACALAAVYVHEGAPRELARSRRDMKVIVPQVVNESRRTFFVLQQSRPERFAVGDDAIDYWAVDPGKARARREQFAREFQKRK